MALRFPIAASMFLIAASSISDYSVEVSNAVLMSNCSAKIYNGKTVVFMQLSNIVLASKYCLQCLSICCSDDVW